MPKIPVYEQQVKINPTLSQPVAPMNPVEGAYGENVAQANARLGSVVGSIGEKIAQHATAMQERADEKDMLALKQKFTEEHQNILYSQEKDDKGQLKGLMYRQLDNAAGMSTEYETKVAELQKKYMDLAPESNAKEKLALEMGNQRLTFRDSVHKHEAQQFGAAEEQALEASTSAKIKMAAAISDPAKLAEYIDKEKDAYASALYKRGQQSLEVINQKTSEIADKMVGTSVNALLERNPAGARAILEANKDRMSPDVAAQIDKVVYGKELSDEQAAVWSKVSGLKRTDGTSDRGKMESFIDALPASKYTNERKNELKSYVRTMAAGQDQIKNGNDKAIDTQFMNELYDGKMNKGVKLEQALTLAAKYGDGAYDKGTKQELIKKLYTENVKTDPVAFMALWTSTMKGELSTATLKTALDQGKLSGSDFIELAKLNFNEGGHLKPAWDRVNVLLEDKLSNNKEDQHKILTLLREEVARDPKLKAEDLLKKANDLLKGDPSTGVWGWFEKKLYKTTYESSDIKMQARGQINQDFGPNIVDAIMHGAEDSMLRSGKPGKASIADFNQYLDKYGQESLKPGGAAYEAILKIRRAGAPATIENIDHMLKAKGVASK